ncbi:MAG: hypothetical protein V1799_00640 [bacterium]
MDRNVSIVPYYQYQREYQRIRIITPFSTLFITIIVVIFFLIGNWIFKGKESPDDALKMKVKKIEDIGGTLEDLSEYLQQQKTIIIAQDEQIKKLNKANQDLEPIVKAKQEIVDAIIFEAQKKAEDNSWRDRLIGIAIGIISSLFATLIWHFFLADKWITSRMKPRANSI